MMLDCDIESCELSSEEFDSLSDIASLLTAEMQDTRATLEAYSQQLNFIRDLLKPFGHNVFQGLTAILIEGIDVIVKENRQLSSGECVFLKKIPEILSEYAFIPTSKIPDAHLLTHFKNSQWIRPISAQEEKEFIKFLLEGNKPGQAESAVSQEPPQAQLVLAEEKPPEPGVEVIEEVEPESELLDFIQSDSFEVETADLDNTHNNPDSSIDELEKDNVLDLSTLVNDTQATETEEVDLADFLQQASDEVPDDPGTHLSEEFTEQESPAESVIDLAAFASPGETKAADIDESEVVVEDEGFDSEISLLDMLEAQPQDADLKEEQDIENTESVEAIEDEIQPGSAFSITPEQQELVKLIGDELTEIISDKDLITLNETDSEENRREHLITIAEQVENISNAIDLIGLEGLCNACRYLSGNIHQIAKDGPDLTEAQSGLIATWPEVILAYLNGIAAEQPSLNLVTYLQDPSWPKPISDKARSALVSLLKSPQLEEEEKESRQSQASADDMSLELPEDVNPELLEGLLQDLPVQSGEFSVAIQNLQDQKNLEYLEVAQRIAHTLKGAGNVVGVKGIANLTHHLEDILEIQSKASLLPSAQLLDVLTDAADCLETMSEALLGIDEPPDNAVAIYQSVLDWANRLDVEGATEYVEPAESPAKAKVPAGHSGEGLQLVETPEPAESGEFSDTEKTESTESKKPISIENMLRVPAKLADDLLRLAGENLISTSQIQEYIKIIQNRYKNLKEHDLALQKLSFDLEHIVDVQGIASNANKQNIDDGFDPLELDQYHELHSMSRRLVEIAADSIELTQDLENDFSELQNLVLNQDRLQKENEELVLRTRMVPTNTIIPRLKRGVKQACRLTGKQVDLEVIDSDTYMDSEVLNGLIEPLMHILRNSVDHGIEPAEERIAANKESKGHIKLVFIRRGDQIVINIQDDGKGLDLNKIQEKAVLMGLADTESDVTESNLQKYILQPGFSTRTEVSHVSGRGIGLDVVNSKIRELKGSIEVGTEPGRGCLFSLTLPVSSFSVHSLLVRVRENVYAFSNRGVEEILYPGLGELLTVDDEVVYKFNEQLYNVSLIEALLNVPEDRRDTERSNRPVILTKDDNGVRRAILVQEVLDSRDVVVKSMGPYIPKIPGVVGATVLGDGSISPVIDLPELMSSAKEVDGEITYHKAENEVEGHKHLPYVLVVDDSLSARKSLAQFVQDLGLDVRTARDGMEAVSLINVRKPDLILVDMEMPRMNGLELTGHIRAGSNTQDMPVIMITSRSTDKHRKAAIDKGVDHYMVKPFAEDELASHINTALKIA